MTEEQKPGEMPETKQEQPTEKPAEMVSISAAELEQIRTALKKANGEAAKYRKSAEQFEADQKAKQEAEMTALQKAEAKAKELETALATERKARMQTEIAARVGLPAKLASRLQGETPEELEADAKAILEDLPKPKPANPGAANPGANANQGETYEQKKARLRGQDIDPFDPEVAKKYGGGVFIVGE